MTNRVISGAAGMGCVVGLVWAAGTAGVIKPGHKQGFVLAGEPVPVGPMAGTPVASDVDGDGDLDVVLACGPCCGRDPDPESGHVVVLLNDGKGGLSHAGDPVKLLDSALGVAVGRIDGDTIPDAVVYHHHDYRVGLLRGRPGGGLSEPEYLTLFEGDSPHVHSVALADVNTDGHLDLCATLVDDHAMAVLLGDGRGGFRASVGQPYFAMRHPYQQLNLVEVTGDGHLDAVLTDVRGNGLTVLAGSGTGMFAPSQGFTLNAHTPIASAERPMAAAVGDVDGDGDLDAVCVIEETPLAVVMENVGGGVYREHTQNPVGLAVASTSIALGDLNGDGVLDLVAGGTMTDRVSVCVGYGDGTFDEPEEIRAGGESPSVLLADLDGDGRLDIVTGNYDSGTVSVLLNRVE
ncbi:MAG: FG-GAP repeat domain-containing protein [Phycisphaerales bacterium JB040]